MCLCVVAHPCSLTRCVAGLLCCCDRLQRDTQTVCMSMWFVCLLLALSFSLACLLLLRATLTLARSLAVSVRVWMCCCVACARRVGDRLRRDTQPQNAASLPSVRVCRFPSTLFTCSPTLFACLRTFSACQHTLFACSPTLFDWLSCWMQRLRVVFGSPLRRTTRWFARRLCIAVFTCKHGLTAVRGGMVL